MIDLAEKVEKEHQNEIERTKPRTRKDWMMMGWTCMTIAYLSPYFLKRLYPEHIPDLGTASQ